MSWRVGDIYLAAGQTVTIGFHWNKPGDEGPQWAMPHPKAGEPSSPLFSEGVGKLVRCTIGKLVINGSGEYSCGDPKTAYWEYFVRIRNEGGSACRFELDGGRAG